MTSSTQDPRPGTPATGGTPIGAQGDRFADRARTDARTAASAARSAADEVAAAAHSTSEDLKERAQGVLDDAKESARSVAGEQKNLAAERLTGFADALRHASSDLDEQGQSVVSGFVRQAADGLEHFSGAVRRNDVDDLIGSIEDFARRQPAAFIGGAVLAGFGIARFMKSSSERRRERTPDYGRSSVETGARFGAGPGTTYEGGV